MDESLFWGMSAVVFCRRILRDLFSFMVRSLAMNAVWDGLQPGSSVRPEGSKVERKPELRAYFIWLSFSTTCAPVSGFMRAMIAPADFPFMFLRMRTTVSILSFSMIAAALAGSMAV